MNTHITETSGITGANVTPLTYHGFVNLKAKRGEDIIAQLTAEKAHLLHMAIGVSGEVAELAMAVTKENAQEEAGDIEFYLQGMTLHRADIGSRIYDPLPRKVAEVENLKEALVESAGLLLDVVKKYAIYNKQLDVLALNQHWYNMHHLLANLYQIWNTDRQAIISQNVDKLNKRYVRGYSDTEAQVRADKDGE